MRVKVAIDSNYKRQSSGSLTRNIVKKDLYFCKVAPISKVGIVV